MIIQSKSDKAVITDVLDITMLIVAFIIGIIYKVKKMLPYTAILCEERTFESVRNQMIFI
jgi:hypothetical protein